MSRVTKCWLLGVLFLLSLGCVAWVKWGDPYPSPGGLAALSTLLGLTSAGWVYLLLRRKSSRWPGYGAGFVLLLLVWWSPLRLLVQGCPTENADLYLRATVEKGSVEYYWKPTDMTFRMPATRWEPYFEMPGVLAFCYNGHPVPRVIFRNDPMYCYETSTWEEFRELQLRSQKEAFGNQDGVEVRDMEINQAPGMLIVRSHLSTTVKIFSFQLGPHGYGGLLGGRNNEDSDEDIKAINEAMDSFVSTVRSRRPR